MRGIGDTDNGGHTTQHEGGACHAGPPCRGRRRRKERSSLLRMMIRTTRWLVVIMLQWHRFGVHGVIGLLFVRLGMLLMSDVVVFCDDRL